MDNVPPPYSPAAEEGPAPRLILNGAPTLPPSYDVATAGDDSLAPELTASDDGHDGHAHPPRSSLLLPSSPAGQSHPRPVPVAALSTSPSSSTFSFVSRLSALKHRRHSKSAHSKPSDTETAERTPAQTEDLLANIVRFHPWRRTWGPWPKSLDEALRKAALHGDTGLVQALLAAGAPIRFTDRYAAIKIHDGSALHAALRGGAPEIADVIVGVFWGRVYASSGEGAADTRTLSLVDARDGQGCAPLHVAAEAGATDAARRLLRRGAEVDAVDDCGRTALHMAARSGRRETAALLIGAGARTDHLMVSADDDDGVAAPWAHALARGEAGREKLAALGDHDFVTQLVASVVAEARGDKGNSREMVSRKTGETRASLSEASSSSSFGAPSYVHGSGRSPKPTVVLTDPFTLPPDASSLKPRAPEAAPAPQRIHQDPWRRHKQPTSSLTLTPAYAIWRDGLETLQAEHRAQKARDARNAVPDGMKL